jgi:hypothetical protein
VSADNYVWDVDTLSRVKMQQPVITGDTIDVTLAGVATEAKQDTGNTSLANLLTELQLKADLTETQPVRLSAGTATVTTVADTATSTTLLASNANRLGAAIQNDSSAVLYVKFGTTASATDYTVRMVQYAYYEVPYGYTGRIDGIWASDPGDGAARITELT